MKKILLPLLLFFLKQTNAQIITSVAGSAIPGFATDGGPATSVSLMHPFGVTTDIAGNFYIADLDSPNVVHVVNSAGIIHVFAGGSYNGLGDGGPAMAAQLNEPSGIAFDGMGNAYIADTYNNRVRKVNTAGIITTIAGNGTPGGSGDGLMGTAAQLNLPNAVATDAKGNVYICDQYNNSIRMVNTSGIITTFAGTYSGFGGDGGPATTAQLYQPSGVAVDNAGNVYISDKVNSRIRMVNTAGIITSIAGTLSGNGYSGDGGPATAAQVNIPNGLTVDAVGNLYIADYFNNRIRQINTAGIINTVAGNGNAGFSGDGGPATLAEIAYPTGVAVSPSGNLYIADFSNSKIRMVTNIASGISTFNTQNPTLKIYPNPANNKITIDANDVLDVKLFDVLGKHIASTKQNQIDLSNLPEGVYFIQVQTKQNTTTQKIIVQH